MSIFNPSITVCWIVTCHVWYDNEPPFRVVMAYNILLALSFTTGLRNHHTIYCIAGNFGGKILWQIAENKSFGGIYFGSWASFLAIMIFITKWLIKCAGNLTGLWDSFRSVRTKSMMKCNWKVHKSLLRLIWTVFVASVFTATVVWIAFLALTDNPTLLPPSLYKTFWRSVCSF